MLEAINCVFQGGAARTSQQKDAVALNPCLSTRFSLGASVSLSSKGGKKRFCLRLQKRLKMLRIFLPG